MTSLPPPREDAHVCYCDACASSPFEDRCKYQAEVELLNAEYDGITRLGLSHVRRADAAEDTIARLRGVLEALVALDGVRVDENNPDVYFVPCSEVRRVAASALACDEIADALAKSDERSADGKQERPA